MGRSIWVSILSLQQSPSDLNCAAAASRCGAKQWKKTLPSANGNPCGPKWKIGLRKRTIRSHFDLASFQFRFRRCFQMETTTCIYPDVNGARGNWSGSEGLKQFRPLVIVPDNFSNREIYIAGTRGAMVAALPRDYRTRAAWCGTPGRPKVISVLDTQTVLGTRT